MDFSSILTILDAGGSAAMIGLFFLMWKFDRRLVKIETLMDKHLTDEQEIRAMVDRRIHDHSMVKT